MELLHQGGYIDAESFNSIDADSKELIKLRTAIVETAKLAKRSA